MASLPIPQSLIKHGCSRYVNYSRASVKNRIWYGHTFLSKTCILLALCCN